MCIPMKSPDQYTKSPKKPNCGTIFKQYLQYMTTTRSNIKQIISKFHYTLSGMICQNMGDAEINPRNSFASILISTCGQH